MRRLSFRLLTSCVQSHRSCSSSDHDAMESLTRVFRSHPSALRLHRELTLSLSRGDSERAADLATVLADTVRRVSSHALDHSASPTENDTPPVGLEDIEPSVELTRRGLLRRSPDTAVDALLEPDVPTPSHSPAEVELKERVKCGEVEDDGEEGLWHDPGLLTMTLLESTFETTVPDGEDENPLSTGRGKMEAHEQERLALLDAYLAREGPRWSAQKSSIGCVILNAARRHGLRPAQLCRGVQRTPTFANEDSHDGNDTDGRMRVLRHCNLIVRGESPDLFSGDGEKKNAALLKAVEVELEVLLTRMAAQGTPLTAQEREMARCELILTKSRMRYVVGLHRELQVALNAERPTGAEEFIQMVVEALNKDTPDGTETRAEDVELLKVLGEPVLPFTFMLKMCLWFDLPRDNKRTRE